MTKITDENKAHHFHISLCFSKSHKIVIWMKSLKKKKKKTLYRLKIRDKSSLKSFILLQTEVGM